MLTHLNKILLPLLLVSLLASGLWAKPRIQMELVTESGFPITGSQRWLKLLSGIGVEGLRIRPSRATDEVSVTNVGTKDRPSYKLVGILTAREQLILPGKTFTSRDLGALKRYLETLEVDGTEALTDKKGAFGLTAKQLIAAVEDMERPIPFSTEGVAPQQIVQKIAALLDGELVVDRTAARVLREAEVCDDQLQNVSAGTGLAAVLRPHGLIMQPIKPRGGNVQYVVRLSSPDSEPWPIGWPSEERINKVVPIFFSFINVEIDGIKLDQALGALQGRVKIPFLYDYNSMALARIDPSEVTVKVPPGRAHYKRIIDSVLTQSKLKGEIRIDEAGHPILWISSIKR